MKRTENILKIWLGFCMIFAAHNVVYGWMWMMYHNVTWFSYNQMNVDSWLMYISTLIAALIAVVLVVLEDNQRNGVR